jgi:hypothetical protein
MHARAAPLALSGEALALAAALPTPEFPGFLLLNNSATTPIFERNVLKPGMAHQLCRQCEQLQFTLHDTKACASLDCEFKRLKWEDSLLHSELHQIHPSFDALDASARNGRHLCSLIVAGLRSMARDPVRDFEGEDSTVWVALDCSTLREWEGQVTEYLIAGCGQSIAYFRVEILPSTTCADPVLMKSINCPRDSSENRPYHQTQVEGRAFDAKNMLFRAIYIGEKEEPGKNTPGTQQPGEVCYPYKLPMWHP